MLALAVTDPTLKRMLVEHLLQRIEEGGATLDHLLSAGLDPDQLDRLRHTPARDLIQIANMAQLNISAGFGDNSINTCLDRVEAMRRDHFLFEYFVAHGASTEMLMDLFKRSREEVRKMREVLLPHQPLVPSAGRPRLPAEDRRQAIHEDWAQVQRTMVVASKRERYFTLHQKHQDLSIAQLLGVLNEFVGDKVANGQD